MKKFTKFVAIIISFMLVLSFASCGLDLAALFNIADEEESTQQVVTSEESENEESNSESYSESESESEFQSSDESNTESESDDESESLSESGEESGTEEPEILTEYTQSQIVERLTALRPDYTTSYVYQQMIADDPSNEDIINDVYEKFYNASFNFMISTDNKSTTPTEYGDYLYICDYEYEDEDLTSIIASVMVNLTREAPLFYFLYPGYMLTTKKTTSMFHATTTYVFEFCARTEYATYASRLEANNALLNLIDGMEEEMDSLLLETDYTKVKAIHDYICRKYNYAYDSEHNPVEDPWAHAVDGFAQHGVGVCECYSKTYNLFCQIYGIESICVTGGGLANSVWEGHMWNYTKLGDKWYLVDVTWDDQEYGVIRDYFLVKSQSNHATDETGTSTYGVNYLVTLPELSETNYPDLLV